MTGSKQLTNSRFSLLKPYSMINPNIETRLVLGPTGLTTTGQEYSVCNTSMFCPRRLANENHITGISTSHTDVMPRSPNPHRRSFWGLPGTFANYFETFLRACDRRTTGRRMEILDHPAGVQLAASGSALHMHHFVTAADDGMQCRMWIWGRFCARSPCAPHESFSQRRLACPRW